LFGAWMPVGAEEPMTKDADGVWTVTAGPLAPNGYLYTFNIDGVTVADPINPDVKLRQRTSATAGGARFASGRVGRWRTCRTAAWK
jgi:1,4-alpha-glucan branching enzyme